MFLGNIIFFPLDGTPPHYKKGQTLIYKREINNDDVHFPNEYYEYAVYREPIIIKFPFNG